MPELSAEDQGAILSLFQQYGDAWGRRDARGCATLFAADGDLITADGEVCTGPDAVEAYYNRQLSAPYKVAPGVPCDDVTAAHGSFGTLGDKA